MNAERIDEGLWRWTGLHPDWQPGQGWEREVGCVYGELPEAIVLIDPLIPPEEPGRFLEFLDRDVERLGRPVSILLTTESHARSSAELAARYSATFDLPPGVETHKLGWGGERAYWLAPYRALVFGDALLGGPRVPADWAGEELPALLDGLRSLLDLAPERLLVSHGEPVLEGGRQALARAVG